MRAMEPLLVRKELIACCSDVHRVGHLPGSGPPVSHGKDSVTPQLSPLAVPPRRHTYVPPESRRFSFTGSVIEPDVSTSIIRFGLALRALISRVSVVCEMASGSTGSKSYVWQPVARTPPTVPNTRALRRVS